MNMPSKSTESTKWNPEKHLKNFERYSDFGRILQRKIAAKVKRYEDINTKNLTRIDALPDLPQQFEEFQKKILMELFESEKELIETLFEKKLLKGKSVTQRLARKERLMRMAERVLEEFPDLRQNAELVKEISQYLLSFNEIFKKQSNIPEDGKWALEHMESSLPGLTAEIAVLEHEKEKKDELKLQRELLGYEAGLCINFIEELWRQLRKKATAAKTMRWKGKSIEDFVGEIEILYEEVMKEIAALQEEEENDGTDIRRSTIKMGILQHEKSMYEQLISDLKAIPLKNRNGNETVETLASLAMAAIDKRLREKIEILEDQMEDLQKIWKNLQQNKSGIVEVNGKQFIVIKVNKLSAKKLKIFGQRLRSALGSKMPRCQMHLLNNILEGFSCIAIEVAERIEDNADGMTEYQQIGWVIEETRENLKKATGMEIHIQKGPDGQKLKLYIMGDMADPDIGDISIKKEDDEILIPRKILRKRIQEAAKPFMDIFKRIRQETAAQMRKSPIQDKLKEKRNTYNRQMRGIIEWSAKMAKTEEDGNKKRSLYEKALEYLYKAAPSFKGKNLEACCARISDIEKKLAEMAIRRGDNNGFADHATKMVKGLTKLGKPCDENHPHFTSIRKTAAEEAKKPPKGLKGKLRLKWKEIKDAVRKEWNEFRAEIEEDFKTGE